MTLETKYYDKLIRDKIPQIIEATGGVCRTEILEEGQYLSRLEEKLSEDVGEYLESGEEEELADLLEVMEALAKERGWLWEDVLALQREKRERRGGFEKRLLLTEVVKG